MPDEFERLRIARDSFEDLARENAIAADRLAAEIARLLSDLTAAREERDEALQLADQRLALIRCDLETEERRFLRMGFHEKHAELFHRAEAAESEASALRERVAKLEEALKPFGTDPEMSGIYAFKLGQGITISAPQWFEAARAALSSSDPEKQP